MELFLLLTAARNTLISSLKLYKYPEILINSGEIL